RRRTAARAATPALVKNLAATREARRPLHCSGCERRARDAFLHDAGDPRFALHLRSAKPGWIWTAGAKALPSHLAG
ncbi:Os11g0589600, partial [Oryza sativa Japonica Group]